ncbi:MAG: hypothetical protein V8R75_01135 [Oscillospiraceae bacterium]
MCEMTDLERMAAYDRMYVDLLREREQVLSNMERLRAAGKIGVSLTSSCWPRS